MPWDRISRKGASSSGVKCLTDETNRAEKQPWRIGLIRIIEIVRTKVNRWIVKYSRETSKSGQFLANKPNDLSNY